MGYFQVRYASRVVIYERKMFIRLATGLKVMGDDSCSKGREFEPHIMDGHLYIFHIDLL